jgi:uncharacterized protein (DUF488 family)
MNDLYTIGHSTHTVDRLLELLRTHAISAVADVRSSPYSRYTPQFNREPLAAALRPAEIAYVFLGNHLGARPENQALYKDGKVQFHLLAQTPPFQEGLERVRRGLLTHRIALLCSEKDPITCHRMILVCRSLRGEDIHIRHIHEDATVEKHPEAEQRLRRAMGVLDNDLFAGEDELVQRAYDLQAGKIAYVEKREEGGEE